MSTFTSVIDICNNQLQSLLLNPNVKVLTSQANFVQKIVNNSLYQNQIENAIKILENNNDIINYTKNISNINSLLIAQEKKTSKPQNTEYQIKRVTDYVIVNSLVENISTDETDEFFNFISEYPYLAYKNETGKKIYTAIANSNKHCYPVNQDLYRVRVPKTKNIPYSFREMFSPQYGDSTHGRFSFVGINYLYFSECFQDALLETKANIDKQYTYIKVRNNKVFSVLDITNLKIPLFSRCHIIVSEESINLKTEYLIPNYIANCAYENGFEGILYNSVSGKGRNLVLFGSGYCDFTEIETIGKNY